VLEGYAVTGVLVAEGASHAVVYTFLLGFFWGSRSGEVCVSMVFMLIHWAKIVYLAWVIAIRALRADTACSFLLPFLLCGRGTIETTALHLVRMYLALVFLIHMRDYSKVARKPMNPTSPNPRDANKHQN
jgi:hypothetical protein